MKEISNANHALIIRLLKALNKYNTLKPLARDEARRKAGLLVKKLEKAEESIPSSSPSVKEKEQ